MLRRQNEFFKSLIRLNDLMLVSFAWWVAYGLRFHTSLFGAPEDYLLRHYVTAWLLILLTWGGVFEYLNLYRPRRLSNHRREVIDLIKGSVLALLVFLGSLFLSREIILSRIVVVLFWFTTLVCLHLSHVSLREGLRFIRRRGYNLRHMVVVGTTDQAKWLLSRLQMYGHLGYEIVGCFIIDAVQLNQREHEATVIADHTELLTLLKSGKIDGIFVTLPLEQSSRLAEFQRWLGDEPIDLYFVPDLGNLAMLRGNVEELDGMHIISLQTSPLYGWHPLFKRAMDLLVGGLALFLSLPAMILIAIGVKLTSPGPILYRQERMGLDGERFKMLKFRTMVDDAERLTGPVWSAEDDPRITTLGRWLRRMSLDELPQLINVLRGDMSLVGPRPERAPLIEEFRKSIPKYMLRQKVKAGMTGWAQVNGWCGNTSLERRIEHDIHYIEHWSLVQDLKILALTLMGGFIRRNIK